ncbi:asparagine synthase-related protein [Solwaraspora sp. WMMD406]|uniref:asparagine synthetase B family protein n=1 Tax=Solwaraspora sp. WMMD406 TaxID=3016095 RepID=UPI0024169239|nr:asparagine synthase-related protein [Solwaraspora sp. WMMD406]MDG4763563.1 asparagine synthase-related protein [Solwaraspora sp. WMMD406]
MTAAGLPADAHASTAHTDPSAAIAVRWRPGERGTVRRDVDGSVVIGCVGDQPDLLDRYERYGDDLLRQLRGAFVVAIWDRRRRRLLLARDRTGEHPLYWSLRGGQLGFASQLRAVAADPQAGGDVDLVALHHYLTYRYVPAPWSILASARKVPPGTVLIWQDGRVTTRRYWQFEAAARAAGVSTDPTAERLVDPAADPAADLTAPDAVAETRHRLTDAVRHQLPASGQPTVLLSGGMGSALVAAAVAHCAPTSIRTSTVGYADPRLDRTGEARRIAAHLGADHQEYRVDEIEPAVLSELARFLDEPFGDPAAVTHHLVARFTGVRSAEAFCGVGGGVVFGGFPHHLLLDWLSRWPDRIWRLPVLHRLGAALVGRSSAGTPVRRLGRLLEVAGCRPPLRYARIVAQYSAEQKDALYTDAVRAELVDVDSYGLAEAAYGGSPADTDLARMIDADVRTYLPGAALTRLYPAAGGYGLSLRAPLLDHRLIEWGRALPSAWKAPVRHRSLAQRVAAGWLPADLALSARSPTRVPVASWLRHQLRDMSWDLLTDQTAQGRGLFRPAAVRRLLDDHQAGIDNSGEIFTLLQWELWARGWPTAPYLTVSASASTGGVSPPLGGPSSTTLVGAGPGS